MSKIGMWIEVNGPDIRYKLLQVVGGTIVCLLVSLWLTPTVKYLWEWTLPVMFPRVCLEGWVAASLIMVGGVPDFPCPRDDDSGIFGAMELGLTLGMEVAL